MNIYIIPVIFFTSLNILSSHPKNEHDKASIQTRLEERIVPDVDIENYTCESILHLIIARSKTLDNPNVNDVLTFKIDIDDQKELNKKYTLGVHEDISLYELLDLVSKKMNVQYFVKKDTIFFRLKQKNINKKSSVEK